MISANLEYRNKAYSHHLEAGACLKFSTHGSQRGSFKDECILNVERGERGANYYLQLRTDALH
jgi:hypothetical protein